MQAYCKLPCIFLIEKNKSFTIFKAFTCNINFNIHNFSFLEWHTDVLPPKPLFPSQSCIYVSVYCNLVTAKPINQLLLIKLHTYFFFLSKKLYLACRQHTVDVVIRSQTCQNRSRNSLTELPYFTTATVVRPTSWWLWQRAVSFLCLKSVHLPVLACVRVPALTPPSLYLFYPPQPWWLYGCLIEKTYADDDNMSCGVGEKKKKGHNFSTGSVLLFSEV